GGVISTLCSALFLFTIAVFNMVVLVNVWKTWRALQRTGRYEEDQLEKILKGRGFLARLMQPLFRLISKSWHMAPLGFLFGLGFDTATEISLFSIAATESARGFSSASIMIFPLLFTAGVCLCYFLILPLALRAADQYAAWMGVDIPFLEAGEYFGFCIKFMIGMGAGFEMPVILLALVKIGLLDYAKLAGFRRYMILINLILGALLTTPEVLTQVAMFIPLQFLYELTIWIAWYWEQPDRNLARRRLAMVIVAVLVLLGFGYWAYVKGWPIVRDYLNARAAANGSP
ncbi:MAG: hypothetical protein EB141_13135, partial [Verrucomicrobia bacterium]|nr:hypothetical protein [Verrucomicrobiota bacterium]